MWLKKRLRNINILEKYKIYYGIFKTYYTKIFNFKNIVVNEKVLDKIINLEFISTTK